MDMKKDAVLTSTMQSRWKGALNKELLILNNAVLFCSIPTKIHTATIFVHSQDIPTTQRGLACLVSLNRMIEIYA